MIKLEMTFTNSVGHKHTWVPKVASTTLTPEEVNDAMTRLTKLPIFKKGEVTLFSKVDSARYVETIETEVVLPVTVPAQ